MAGIRAETSASGTSYDPRDGGWLVFTWRSQGSHLRAQPKEDTPTGTPGGLDLGVLRMERLPEVGFREPPPLPGTADGSVLLRDGRGDPNADEKPRGGSPKLRTGGPWTSRGQWPLFPCSDLKDPRALPGLKSGGRGSAGRRRLCYRACLVYSPSPNLKIRLRLKHSLEPPDHHPQSFSSYFPEGGTKWESPAEVLQLRWHTCALSMADRVLRFPRFCALRRPCHRYKHPPKHSTQILSGAPERHRSVPPT